MPRRRPRGRSPRGVRREGFRMTFVVAPFPRLRRAVPHDNPGIKRVGVHQTETTQIVPGDAARTPVIAGNFGADLFWHTLSFGDGVAAHEECPRALRVGPRL